LEKRKYERRPFVKVFRYYIQPPHMEKIKKIGCEGVSTDISKGGLGMVTDYPLRRGDVLFFEPEIDANDFTVKASTVAWASEIENNIYRVGLEFHMVRFPSTVT
jgi:hypothetical protein